MRPDKRRLRQIGSGAVQFFERIGERDARPLPGWLASLGTKLLPLVFAAYILAFVHDAAHNHLGSSNGRFISFMDTLNSAYQFRAAIPMPKKKVPKHTPIGLLLRVAHLIAANVVVKFAAGTAVSVLVGKTPVIFQGPRHMVSFFVGLVLLWACPGDVVFLQMSNSRAVRLLVDMAVGLYKLRKAIFAVEAASALSGHGTKGFVLAFVVAFLAVDGNTINRRATLWLEHAWANARYSKPAKAYQRRITQNKLYRDGMAGLKRFVRSTVIPLGAVTTMLWFLSDIQRLSSRPSLPDDIRIGLLLFFMWRHGIFDELMSIHIVTTADRSPAVSPKAPSPSCLACGADIRVCGQCQRDLAPAGGDFDDEFAGRLEAHRDRWLTAPKGLTPPKGGARSPAQGGVSGSPKGSTPPKGFTPPKGAAKSHDQGLRQRKDTSPKS